MKSTTYLGAPKFTTESRTYRTIYKGYTVRRQARQYTYRRASSNAIGNCGASQGVNTYTGKWASGKPVRKDWATGVTYRTLANGMKITSAVTPIEAKMTQENIYGTTQCRTNGGISGCGVTTAPRTYLYSETTTTNKSSIWATSSKMLKSLNTLRTYSSYIKSETFQNGRRVSNRTYLDYIKSSYASMLEHVFTYQTYVSAFGKFSTTTRVKRNVGYVYRTRYEAEEGEMLLFQHPQDKRRKHELVKKHGKETLYKTIDAYYQIEQPRVGKRYGATYMEGSSDYDGRAYSYTKVIQKSQEHLKTTNTYISEEIRTHQTQTATNITKTFYNRYINTATSRQLVPTTKSYSRYKTITFTNNIVTTKVETSRDKYGGTYTHKVAKGLVKPSTFAGTSSTLISRKDWNKTELLLGSYKRPITVTPNYVSVSTRQEIDDYSGLMSTNVSSIVLIAQTTVNTYESTFIRTYYDGVTENSTIQFLGTFKVVSSSAWNACFDCVGKYVKSCSFRREIAWTFASTFVYKRDKASIRNVTKYVDSPQYVATHRDYSYQWDHKAIWRLSRAVLYGRVDFAPEPNFVTKTTTEALSIRNFQPTASMPKIPVINIGRHANENIEVLYDSKTYHHINSLYTTTRQDYKTVTIPATSESSYTQQKTSTIIGYQDKSITNPDTKTVFRISSTRKVTYKSIRKYNIKTETVSSTQYLEYSNPRRTTTKFDTLQAYNTNYEVYATADTNKLAVENFTTNKLNFNSIIYTKVYLDSYSTGSITSTHRVTRITRDDPYLTNETYQYVDNKTFSQAYSSFKNRSTTRQIVGTYSNMELDLPRTRVHNYNNIYYLDYLYKGHICTISNIYPANITILTATSNTALNFLQWRTKVIPPHQNTQYSYSRNITFVKHNEVTYDTAERNKVTANGHKAYVVNIPIASKTTCAQRLRGNPFFNGLLTHLVSEAETITELGMRIDNMVLQTYLQGNETYSTMNPDQYTKWLNTSS